MENNANRWMATIAILGLFGILAAAGTRSTARQTTQNVLVTNTASQPVPIPAKPSTGAYIVSVANAPNVKVLNSGDSTSADVLGTFNIAATFTFDHIKAPIPNTTPVFIDSVSVYSSAGAAGEYAHLAWLYVTDSQQVGIAEPFFVPQVLGDTPFYSAYSSNFRLFVPKGGSLYVYAERAASTSTTAVDYSLTYHTVPM